MSYRDSRLRLTNTITVIDPATGRAERPRFVNLRVRVSKQAVDDQEIVVTAASNDWARLGLKYEADARAWWAIADISNIVDPFTEIEVGKNLQGPSQARFFMEIMAAENRAR